MSGQPSVTLRPLTGADLPAITPWFEDSDTRRFLGGPEWPGAMLAVGERSVGAMFRGATQTGAYHYLAHAGGRAIGYVDCGTFDRCTVYEGEGPVGPIITDTIDAVTGSIAFVIDPALRGRGLGRAMIMALTVWPQLAHVQLFEAGVEPENIASRHCLEAAGFRLRSVAPDFEGMLYYRAWRADPRGESAANVALHVARSSARSASIGGRWTLPVSPSMARSTRQDRGRRGAVRRAQRHHRCDPVLGRSPTVRHERRDAGPRLLVRDRGPRDEGPQPAADERMRACQVALADPRPQQRDT